MSDTIYDLTQGGLTTIKAEMGQIGSFYWAGFPALDTGYTLTINGQTYTVGSGITLTTSPQNTITWGFDFTTFTAGVYYGQITSDSKDLGVYFKRKIKLIIE